MAMAMASAPPSFGSASAATNVAKPSGKLCKPIAMAVIKPMFFSFLASIAL